MDLSLAHPNQLFFIPDVDFNVPPPDVRLDDFLKGQVRIGADEVSWSSVERSA